ncbi:hypothetical protein [Simiduia aestuariiviva]|uniref:DUF4304 domain-containing protein n=1 Tax=Simiduia aestuariiviva TaxID=1510459 RepID=A0A839UVW7_9GAMM|nr:hypothetical protein [Simiduia aestuariiviva]MBB3170216.1 hypothetical protein [Simiduia aestuariiviva]
MASRAKPLNDEMKRSFYPWVKASGFIKQKSTDSHFVEFRRETTSGVDVFEVQWDKYWRPYFVVNFGKEEATDTAWRKGGRLQRKRGGSMSNWFGLPKPMLYKLVTLSWSYKPEEVVEELKAAFGELESWWENGEIGKHLYFIDLHA